MSKFPASQICPDGHRRMLITIEYDGHQLVGWQIQENGPSVQAYLEAAAEKLTTQKTLIYGAGRTDAGVHATAQAAHLDVPIHLDERAIVMGLNNWLETRQVSVLSARAVPADFHARFDARERLYLYRIVDQVVPSALDRLRVWHHQGRLDVSAMHEAAQRLVGRHDFSSFRAAGCQASSPFRTLDELTVTRKETEIHIRARARSFLHHQIRNFAGSLIRVGSGKWSANDLSQILAAKNRKQAGQTAPPHGLYLTGVSYPNLENTDGNEPSTLM